MSVDQSNLYILYHSDLFQLKPPIFVLLVRFEPFEPFRDVDVTVSPLTVFFDSFLTLTLKRICSLW